MDSFTRSLPFLGPEAGAGARRRPRSVAPILPRQKSVLNSTTATPSIAAVTEARTELVLFDLGGVLIAPGGVAPMRELSGLGSDEALWTRWLSCPWVRRFEAGQCTPEEFAAGV